jgi:carboxyl-terminal processing protease
VELAVDPAIADSLRQGGLLESEGRWRDALNHYEEAVRNFPDRIELQQRLSWVRIRFDLVRRYTDPSYLETLGKLTEQQTLEVFAEVAAKIESHHVANPDWTVWMLHGTDGLQAALSDEAFLRQHQIDAPYEKREWVTAEIRRMLGERKVVDRHDARTLVQWAANAVHQRLNVPVQATEMEYVCSLVSSLDNYSTFLTPSQLDEVYSQIEGNFVGLGVELKPEDQSLLVTNVIVGGPAERAGIRTGDRIVGVDAQRIPVISAEEAADRLKGEQGTIVAVDVQHANDPLRTVAVRRDRIEVPSVEGVRMLDADQGVGYLRITSFQKTTSRDVDAALWKLYRSGMRSLIVDVRGNPGGLLNESVDIVDKFLSSGTIVYTRGRIAEEDFDFQAHRVGTWGVPLVVLIDKDSASASEIFASAIHDHHRGTIVGERSYGKGSVQGIFALRSLRGGVRLTTAKFYSPSGQAISHFGVIPDVVVHNVARPDENGSLPSPQDDPALGAALKVAQQNLAQR